VVILAAITDLLNPSRRTKRSLFSSDVYPLKSGTTFPRECLIQVRRARTST
jgi:hypothetical protein